MTLLDFATGLGIIGIVIIILALICIPAIAAVFVAMLIANHFALSGFAWWAVVIVVFLIISSLINMSTK